MVSLTFIPRFSGLSKNDSCAQVQSSGRNGCWLFSQVGIQTSFVLFFFFWWFGKWGAGGGERMLPNHQKAEPAYWGDAKIWQSSWRPPHKARWQHHPKTPDTPPPWRQLLFACDFAQPAVRKEPLNTSPEQQRLDGLWLLSSAGSPFSVFPCSPLSAPFNAPSSSGRFGLVWFFLMQPIYFPPLFSFSCSILNLKMRLTLILIYLGFICIINSNHEESTPGLGLYTKFGCLLKKTSDP